MELLNNEPGNTVYPQFREDELRYKQDKEIRNNDIDEDDQNLSDDDITGRDLDVDGADEWDEDNVEETDLDRDDLRDDDELNYDKHQVRNDQFGSLASAITNEDNTPDPNEIPEENGPGKEELEQPEKHEFERGSMPDKEFDYKEQNEVEQPDTPEAPPEHERDVTLTDLDPTFIGIDHNRKTGRMIGHEPGPENNL